MKHVFCTECGNKIEYSYSKPKFCSNCGGKCGPEGLNKEIASRDVEPVDDLAEDETLINEVPSISRLEVDFESNGNNVFTFESLVDEKAGKKPVTKRRTKTLDDFIDGSRG